MSERVVRGRSIDIVRVAESRLTEWRTCFSRQCYRIAASSPIARLPCFAPHTKSVFAQIAELAVVEFGQCAPALVRYGPPAPRRWPRERCDRPATGRAEPCTGSCYCNFGLTYLLLLRYLSILGMLVLGAFYWALLLLPAKHA